MKIPWQKITLTEDIKAIEQLSYEKPCVIFKHSNRCNISSMALFNLEEDWNFSTQEITPYFLDIFAHPALASEIADTFSVPHQSPQLLLIKKGECTYEADHLDIEVEELRECYEDEVWG